LRLHISCSFCCLSEWMSSSFFCLIARISSSPFYFISAISLCNNNNRAIRSAPVITLSGLCSFNWLRVDTIQVFS